MQSKVFAGLTAIAFAFLLAACSASSTASGASSAGEHETSSLGDYGSGARGVGSGANYH